MTAEELATLHAKCFTVPRPWSAGEFHELLTSNACFLCSNNYGFALGRVAGPEAELLTIAVDPAHRRQGLAHKLMLDFEDQAKMRTAKDAFLEVAENNHIAIALYEQFGFAPKGMRKNYYASPNGPSITALVMGKTL
ncbi:ribosomal-protein-alanine N-acetyltransferase [Amylibacter sp. SFDW26]|uniref:ribosomal protein S18-alanine N-acetyltransferase n=1 Tax=Amylibacter sp. SFDW26 TaxID=2652722 RepID=UPI00126145F7|nr:ribosomal protein S18-alanine N-acetyltransferase [Amylibacter sp. SFDW26]KAB7615275.1 ribosomal-protein-alanine N-acetyltransferase [Amylibacter sp. SFDW26]